jgi:hypothetical protein
MSLQLKCPNSKTLCDRLDPAWSKYAPAALTQSHQLSRVKGSTLNPSTHGWRSAEDLRQSFDVMTHVQQLSTNLQAGEFLLHILVHLPEHINS